MSDNPQKILPTDALPSPAQQHLRMGHAAAEGAATIPAALSALANLVRGKGFEAAKRAIVSQVGSVGRGERFDDDVADAVFLRLQAVAQVGRYTDEAGLAYRKAKRLEGEGFITLYRSAPPGAGIRPGDFAAGTKEEAGFYKHGVNRVQAVSVPRRDVIAVQGSMGGGQEYVLLPSDYSPPAAIEHFCSLRNFVEAVALQPDMQRVAAAERAMDLVQAAAQGCRTAAPH